MTDPPSHPALASVLYLRLNPFAGLPVAEQARLRKQLDTVVAAALLLLPERERLVLDAVDGLVIVVISRPAAALETAERCFASAAAPPMSAGLNFGPVLAGAEEGESAGEASTGLMGDGIASACSAAGFAEAGQILATRAFREALAAHTPERETALRAAGTYSDASVRTHELFLAEPGAHLGRRRRLQITGLLWATLIVALAAVLRVTLSDYGLLAAPAVLQFDVTPVGEIWVDGKMRGTAPPLQKLELRAGTHRVEVRRAGFEPLQRSVALKPGEEISIRHAFQPPAVLVFDVTPAGEVWLDGKPRGSVPALARLEVPAGAHRLEIRHEGFPPLLRDVQLEPAQEFRVLHRFARPATVVLDVLAGAEIYVDGAFAGKSAELKELELAAGVYALEIRRKGFPPLKRKLELQPDERLEIRHRFQRPKKTWTDKLKDAFS